jgi:polar amino acid transport system substrate-binding protein
MIIGLALALAMHSAAMAEEPALVAPGTLTYGTAATYPPFQSVDGGQIVGFSVDHGEAIARKLGLKTAIVNLDFGGLIPALQARRFDIINSAMRVTEPRKEQVDFIPYMRIGTNIVVRAGNPKKVGSRTDVCGLNVAVELGSTIEAFAREDSEACTKAGKPPVNVMTFPGRQDASLAVRQSRADAFYDTTPAAVLALTQTGDSFQIVGETFGFTENGIALRKGDPLKTMIEKAQAELVADGSYAALLEKYKFPKEVAVK